MATDAKSILALSACDECYSANRTEARLIKIGLLRAWLLGIKASAMNDAKSLLATAQAACDASCSELLPLVEIGLLRQIALALNPAAVTDAKSLLALSTAAGDASYGDRLELIQLGLLRKITGP